MDPRKLPIDERLKNRCVFCGGQSETKDHCPSKVLLDDPLPENLPVVESCLQCNNGFSLDEEYIACFVESVITGTVDPELVTRPKVRKIYSRKYNLSQQISDSCETLENGDLIWYPELARFEHICLKLARGHLAFELSDIITEKPESIDIFPLSILDEASLFKFELSGMGEIRGWPELGSRAFHRAVGAKPYHNQYGPWIDVQPKRYRYTVDESGGVTVRAVLSEYLAFEITWA